MLTELTELRDKGVAIGPPGSGVRALAEPLLVANKVTGSTARLVPLLNREALRALKEGEVDATLPPGTIDLALRDAEREVRLIGTKAMLVARDSLAPTLVDLLLDAAREVHAQQGVFEADDEFPNTAPVDLPVLPAAVRHLRYGPSVMHRYLPFFVATAVERLVILLVPLLFLVPLFNALPQLLSWRERSRIFRWYGELMLLERDVAERTGTLPIAKWLADLDRIEQAARRIRTSTSHASEAYTLREHIGLVRRAVRARAPAAGSLG